jgi:hypothetical protein
MEPKVLSDGGSEVEVPPRHIWSTVDDTDAGAVVTVAHDKPSPAGQALMGDTPGSVAEVPAAPQVVPV